MSNSNQEKVGAGFWLRLAAHFVDDFIISLVLLVVLLIVGTTIIPLDRLKADGDQTSPVTGAIALAVILLYKVGFEGSPLNATPGKRIIGLTVTKSNGLPCSPLRALLRNIFKVFSYATGIGFVLAALPGKRALHDILSGCRVVKVT